MTAAASEVTRKPRRSMRGKWDEDRKRNHEQDKDWADGLSKRIEEQLAAKRNAKRSKETSSWGVALFALFLLALCIGAVLVYRYLVGLLIERVRRHALHIDIPSVAERRSSFCMIGYLVLFAPPVVGALALPVVGVVGWFLGWQKLELKFPSLPGNPYFDVPAVIFTGGFYIVVLVFLFQASQLLSQRAKDLLSKVLFTKLSTGGKADEPFILYLRPFVSTGAVTAMIRLNYKTSMRVELEEQLSSAVRPFGQLLTLGSSLEHIGAGRIQCTDADWQQAVRHLMREALLIVIVASSRPGTWWEIEQVLAEHYMTKTVFIDVPNAGVASSSFAQEWDEIGRLLWSRGYPWPADDPRGRLVYFGASKTPLILPLDGLRLTSLEAALARVIALARNAPISEPGHLTTRQAADVQPAGNTPALAAGSDLRMAQQWFEQGFNSHDPDEQLRCYDEAIRLGLDCAAVYYNRGNANADKGALDDALRDYGEAIRRDPNEAYAYNNRGFTRYVKGDFDGALNDYEEAIRLNPNDTLTHSNRALARKAKIGA